MATGKNEQVVFSNLPPYEQTAPASFGQPVNVVMAQPPGYVTPTGYPPNVIVIQQPNFGVQPVQPTERPSDYLVLSIVSFFFCWPMAICALVYSCNSKSSADAGNYLRAQSEGSTARSIGIAAIVFALIIIAATVVYIVVVGTPSRSYYSYYNNYDY